MFVKLRDSKGGMEKHLEQAIGRHYYYLKLWRDEWGGIPNSSCGEEHSCSWLGPGRESTWDMNTQASSFSIFLHSNFLPLLLIGKKKKKMKLEVRESAWYSSYRTQNLRAQDREEEKARHTHLWDTPCHRSRVNMHLWNFNFFQIKIKDINYFHYDIYHTSYWQNISNSYLRFQLKIIKFFLLFSSKTNRKWEGWKRILAAIKLEYSYNPKPWYIRE